VETVYAIDAKPMCAKRHLKVLERRLRGDGGGHEGNGVLTKKVRG